MSYELRDISELIVILAHAVSFFDCRSITSGRRVYFCDKKINYLLFIGLEVEVDECNLTRTKYNRGRMTATLTILGPYKRSTDLGFHLQVCTNNQCSTCFLFMLTTRILNVTYTQRMRVKCWHVECIAFLL